MRDVQVSIEAYYRSTTGFIEDSEHFTTPVRATVAFIQKVHEVMRRDFGQSQRYQRVFTARLARGDKGAETIEALRYVRNIGQHLIHPVEPDPKRVVGSNMGLGFRTSATWAGIPRRVHRSLHPTTQALSVHYDAHLFGKDVLDSFLDAARFFWEICPSCVHRAADGEWSGFPLRHQAGLSTRLHPEEPLWTNHGKEATSRLHRWMNGRRPGGDRRLICGQVTTAGAEFVVGCTFRGRATYDGFAETADQVDSDIALGYPYHLADPTRHLMQVDDPRDLGGTFTPFLFSATQLNTWIGEPIKSAPRGQDFVIFQDAEFWHEIITKSESLLDRRSQRFAAWFPIR